MYVGCSKAYTTYESFIKQADKYPFLVRFNLNFASIVHHG